MGGWGYWRIKKTAMVDREEEEEEEEGEEEEVGLADSYNSLY